MRAGAKQANKSLEKQVMLSEEGAHMIQVTYGNEDVLMMTTNLPRHLGNSTELEQTSSCTEM